MAEGGRERKIAIVGGIVVLLAGVLFLVFRPSDEPEPFSGGPSPRPTPTRTATASPTPSPTGAPETFDNFDGRDPFRPLVAPEPAPTTGSPAPTPSPGSTGGPRDGQRVELLDIFTQNGTRFATVAVDGTEYTVKSGDTFAGNYKVLSLSSRCGNFAFGDERFTLCIGQEVLK